VALVFLQTQCHQASTTDGKKLEVHRCSDL